MEVNNPLGRAVEIRRLAISLHSETVINDIDPAIFGSDGTLIIGPTLRLRPRNFVGHGVIREEDG